MVALLREHVWDTLLGAVFLFIGLVACLVALLRRNRESRLLVWFGIFIGIYGARMLAHVATVFQLAPDSSWPRGVEIIVNYVLVIPSMLFWAELSREPLRRVFHWLTGVAAAVALMGLAWFLVTGSPATFLRLSTLLAIVLIFVLGVLLVIPGFADKYLLLHTRALRIVMPAIAFVALCVDTMYLFGYPPASFVEPVTFAVWIAAIGYEAATHTFENERRLVSLQSELEMARQIQADILPDCLPQIVGLRIAASYIPMSSVAGDFYHLLALDEHRVGILVADVSGHGVAAALIASMIKVAMQSVADCAPFPDKVLRKLNDILTPELKGRLTSAAYLWIDAEHHLGRYAAAGHPPLLHWDAERGELLRVEQNGLLFGVAAGMEYPMQCLRFKSGDRFLLYTDGLTEPENAAGEPFGDRQLEQIVASHRSLPASGLSQKLLDALRAWQPASVTQQDDITLVAVDVL